MTTALIWAVAIACLLLAVKGFLDLCRELERADKKESDE